MSSDKFIFAGFAGAFVLFVAALFIPAIRLIAGGLLLIILMLMVLWVTSQKGNKAQKKYQPLSSRGRGIMQSFGGGSGGGGGSSKDANSAKPPSGAMIVFVIIGLFVLLFIR